MKKETPTQGRKQEEKPQKQCKCCLNTHDGWKRACPEVRESDSYKVTAENHCEWCNKRRSG